MEIESDFIRLSTFAIAPYIAEPTGLNLIRALADPVAGRIVVANPNLPSSAPRHCASHFFGVAPDDLRIMPAHAATSVRAVVVVPGFRGPRIHHLRGRCGCACDLEQVLAIG